jgi:uroporphyrinogen-III synthase
MERDPSTETHGLAGLRVVSFESRRAAEMAELIRRHGGDPLSAPSMREVTLNEKRQALDYVARLGAGAVDIVILMTGVGLRTLARAVAGEWPQERLAAALRRATLVARGPKPVAALRELGLQPDITAPEPHTWREILATLDAQLAVAGKCVAVQEYGVTNAEFVDGLAARGAAVLRVPIYSWALPENLDPLHLFQVAGDAAGRLRACFQRTLIGSIGPVCSETLREHGLEPDLEPVHPKMGHLVSDAARRGKQMLAVKRAS